MENLITVIIILLIAFVSIIRKISAKQAQKQSSGSPAQAGLMGRINAFINEIQQRIEEQQAREDSPSADEWQQLMEEGAPSRRYQEALDDQIMEGGFDIDDHPEEITPTRRPEAKPMPSPQPPSPPAMPPARAKADLGIPLLGSTMSGANLRRAIIWSEILGPPVALREPGGDRSI